MSLSVEDDCKQKFYVARIIDPTEADVIFVLNKYRLRKIELAMNIAPSMPYDRKKWVDFNPMNGTHFLELLGNRGYYRLSAEGRSDRSGHRILIDPNYRPFPKEDDPFDWSVGGQDDMPNVTDFDLIKRACLEYLRTGDLSHELTEIDPVLAWIATW